MELPSADEEVVVAAAAAAPEHTLSAYDDEPEIEKVRRECDARTRLDNIDKEAGLQILRLFHTFETMMLEMRYGKDRQIEQLRHENATMALSRKQSEMAESLAADLANATRQLTSQAEELRVLRSAVTELQERGGKRGR